VVQYSSEKFNSTIMKKILVFVEEKNGALKRTSSEAITAAMATGAAVVGASIGTGVTAAHVAPYGLTKLVHINHALLERHSSQAVAHALSQCATAEGCDAIFFAANAAGKEIAPRVAVQLKAALIADAVEIIGGSDAVRVKRPVFAGKALDIVESRTSVTVITLRPNVFTAKTSDTPASTETASFAPALDASNCKVVVTNVVRNEGTLDVLEADTIVSGGRGLKGPEHFYLVEDLAKSLGAAVGASRAVVDAGWRPHGDQVGQTGKTVSPKLYVACGISGAVQHLAGMSSSKIIAAINKDKDAPIFKVADYGIVGDVFEVLPKLTAQIAGITSRS
jgi:electron transfer flavoprotein alpha subunit